MVDYKEINWFRHSCRYLMKNAIVYTRLYISLRLSLDRVSVSYDMKNAIFYKFKKNKLKIIL